MTDFAAADPVTPCVSTLAALDLGTNNCRLLVARPRGDEFTIVDSFSRIVRLGEGVASSGRLSERAMARTIAALRVCARIMQRRRVGPARCVATEACRRAVNGADFLARVRRATGIDLEILPNEQEARLALLGCLPLIDPAADHVLLVDIGGGSTELLWLERGADGVGGRLRCATSLPVGVVALSEANAPEPDAVDYEAMVRHVQTLLGPVESAHGLRGAFSGARVQLLGTSGTVTTLAAVLLDLPRYDRRRIDGLTLDIGAIAAVSERLRTMDNRSRASHPCIGAGRADLVVAGCAILEAILRSWPADSLRVADRGLREGILHGLMGRSLERSIEIPAAQPEESSRAGRLDAAEVGCGGLGAALDAG
jgi:exopolyphosphatase/guanosine-5'-triphosphate,3'-diphosphate pyrophosphatase